MNRHTQGQASESGEDEDEEQQQHLDAACVSHEMQGLRLVPFGELAAAEDEAKLGALGQLGG